MSVFVDGKIAATGGQELAEELEANGYVNFQKYHQEHDDIGFKLQVGYKKNPT